MDKARLLDLLEQATADSYGDEEEFFGVLCALEAHLNLPLQAQVLGERIELVGLDDTLSSLRRGIVARVRRGGQEYTLSLADLALVEPDPESAEWLAVYHYWMEL